MKGLFPQSLCPGSCLRRNMLENYCFVWHTVMSLKIEHKHLSVLREVWFWIWISYSYLVLLAQKNENEAVSGHLPAVSWILRKCLSGTEIDSSLFLRESTKFPVANVFYIFFKLFSSNHGSTKPVPVSSCRQLVFGINSLKLLHLCTFSPTHMPLLSF